MHVESDNNYFYNDEFSNNSGLYGGVIYSNFSKIVIVDKSNFHNNSCANDGGALFFLIFDSMTI